MQSTIDDLKLISLDSKKRQERLDPRQREARFVQSSVERGEENLIYLFSLPKTFSCSRPLVAIAEPPAGPGVPSRLVNVPPASVTSRDGAARSQRETSGSAPMSTAPSATRQ